MACCIKLRCVLRDTWASRDDGLFMLSSRPLDAGDDCLAEMMMHCYVLQCDLLVRAHVGIP